MAKVLVTESSLQDIADAIRTKNGLTDTYTPGEMSDAIEAIQIGITPTGTKQISITQNGTTTEDVTNYANAQISVNVSSSSPTLVTKTITENGTYNASSDNADGYSSVTVNVSGGGGGGAGVPGVTLLQEYTFAQNARNAKLTIPSGYDWYFALVKGSFTADDWMYYGIDQEVTSGASHYIAKATDIYCGFAFKTYGTNTSIFPMQNGTAKNNEIFSNTTPSFFWVSGYSKDFVAGTKVNLYGIKYTDL